MKNRLDSEVVLLTPPLMDAMEFPELGVPQLHGFLLGQGVSSLQADLNMELLSGFLDSDKWRGEVLQRLKRARNGEIGEGLEHLLPAHPVDPEQDGVERFLRWLEQTLPTRLPNTKDDGIQVFRRWLDMAVPLLGLRCRDLSLEGVAKIVDKPHPVYDALFSERVLERFQSPRLVGLSLISPTQIHPAVILSRKIKAAWPNTYVVIGGPWVIAAERIVGDFLVRFPSMDAAIVRRGENPLMALVSALREAHDATHLHLESVTNLIYRQGDQVHRTANALPAPIGSLPPPNFDGLNLASYPAAMLPLQTNSRCYWGECLFCYHDSPQTSAGERTPAQSAQDVETLVAQTGNESFFLADCATPVPWMAQFAQELKARAVSIRWAAMCRAERSFTPEICQRLNDSGCSVLMIGLETVSKSGLERIRKGIVPSDVEHAVKCCSQAGIRVHLFLLDFPTNSLQELRDTMEFVFRLSPWVDDFSIQRFQLSVLSRVYETPELLGIHPEASEGIYLDVFDLPYTADEQTTKEEFQAVAAEFRRRFDELKGRVGSPFVAASAEKAQGSTPHGQSEK